jgi:hypothetical protein
MIKRRLGLQAAMLALAIAQTVSPPVQEVVKVEKAKRKSANKGSFAEHKLRNKQRKLERYTKRR